MGRCGDGGTGRERTQCRQACQRSDGAPGGRERTRSAAGSSSQSTSPRRALRVTPRSPHQRHDTSMQVRLRNAQAVPAGLTRTGSCPLRTSCCGEALSPSGRTGGCAVNGTTGTPAVPALPDSAPGAGATVQPATVPALQALTRSAQSDAHPRTRMGERDDPVRFRSGGQHLLGSVDERRDEFFRRRLHLGEQHCGGAVVGPGVPQCPEPAAPAVSRRRPVLGGHDLHSVVPAGALQDICADAPRRCSRVSRSVVIAVTVAGG